MWGGVAGGLGGRTPPEEYSGGPGRAKSPSQRLIRGVLGMGSPPRGAFLDMGSFLGEPSRDEDAQVLRLRIETSLPELSSHIPGNASTGLSSDHTFTRAGVQGDSSYTNFLK